MDERCACTCGLPGCASVRGMIVHGTADGYRRGCRCDSCEAAESRKNSAQKKRRNADLLRRATKHRVPWSVAEVKVIERADLTDYEAGALLGRTLHAVRNKRKKLGIEDVGGRR